MCDTLKVGGDYMTIGENIKRIRKEQGITQKQLSELTGIAEATIIRYEKGKFKPNIKQVERIAEALNVPPYNFLDTEQLSNESKVFDAIMEVYGIEDPDVLESLDAFMHMNHEKQLKVAGYIDAIKD